MKLKTKKLFSIFFHRIFPICCSSFYFISIHASTPSDDIYEPTSALAAYSGLGAASPGDYSSAKANPAILSALKKQYILFGSTGWQRHDNFVEGGILDNTTTSVATLASIKETISRDNYSRDRTYNLDLAYEFPGSDFSIGTSLNYEQINLTNLTSSSNSNQYGGLGVFYQIFSGSSHPLFIGAGANNLFNDYKAVQYDLGVATTFLDGYYSFGVDQRYSQISGLQKVVGNMQVVANKFLDLKASYGYRVKDKKKVWGGGIFFHAPVLQLFYTFASSDSNDTTAFRQTAGAALNFMF